jgi:hypothetical protein
VRRRRKAADLLKGKMAELPKDEPEVSSAFFVSYSEEEVMKRSYQKVPIWSLRGALYLFGGSLIQVLDKSETFPEEGMEK